MKYYEILVKSTTEKSHYEGRFFSKAMSLDRAVGEVVDFLEIAGSNEFKIFTRELSFNEYLKNQKQASKRREISNKLIENFLNMKIDNISYDEINKASLYPEFNDLRDII